MASRLSRSAKVLVVHDDADVRQRIVDLLGSSARIHLTCTAALPDALNIDVAEPHDVVVAGATPAESSALPFVRQILQRRPRPVILVGERDWNQAVAAWRVGVQDFLALPLNAEELLGAVRRALSRESGRQRRLAHERRLRRVLLRLMQERKRTRQQLELVSRDLVGAHRRLFRRVVAKPSSSPNEP